jgi:hypothetical protein
MSGVSAALSVEMGEQENSKRCTQHRAVSPVFATSSVALPSPRRRAQFWKAACLRPQAGKSSAHTLAWEAMTFHRSVPVFQCSDAVRSRSVTEMAPRGALRSRCLGVRAGAPRGPFHVAAKVRTEGFQLHRPAPFKEGAVGAGVIAEDAPLPGCASCRVECCSSSCPAAVTESPWVPWRPVGLSKVMTAA